MKAKPPLEQTLKQGLDQQVEQLDAHSLSRLRQARAAALEQAARGSRWRGFDARAWALPAGGLAALLGLAIGLSVWLQAPAPELELQALSDAEDILVEMAETGTDIEMIEDIEFYDWLALTEDPGDST